MSSSTFHMSNTYQGHQSLYVPPNRPYISRQRSNSLPVGLMSSIMPEEAGMMFSAAERATARRRGNASVDTSARINGLPNNLHALQPPIPVESKSKPSRRRRITQVRDSLPIHHSRESSRALRDLDVGQVNNERPISPSTDLLLKGLPVSPMSPTKRLVTTRSLKSYADGLFQFTQHALVSTIPLVASPPQSPKVFEDELDSFPAAPSFTQRPVFESKFSDWSISTGADSRRSSVTDCTPPRVPLEMSLMSPDSFFAGFDATPRHYNFDPESEASGYASSETFDSPIHLTLTPPSRIAKPEASKDDISYFTNYDHYLSPESRTAMGNSEPPDSLQINLSPIEADSPLTPPPVRRRADTMIRAPLIARSSCSGTPRTTFARSTPTTPFQLSDSVPNWLVGAIC
jgi:hypothetical protein